MVNNGIDGSHKEEWLEALSSFEQAANTRNVRTTSNLISLFRFSLAIADYLKRVSEAIKRYNDLIFDKSKYSDKTLKKLCRFSKHWVNFLNINGPDETRKMLHEFYLEQAEEKLKHAENLTLFGSMILKLLNSKYEYLKVTFDIES